MTINDYKFNRAIELVLQHEGGYVNDPDDPGGETNFGISKRTYPHLDIKKLTEADAKQIYLTDWWLRHRYGEMVNETLSFKVFDIAVNVGASRAARWLQSAVCDIGRQIIIDGIIGDQTISAVNECDSTALVVLFCKQALDHYQSLAFRFPRFISGWIERLFSL